MAGNPACKTFIPMLSPFIDGELVPQERVAVERHLGACRDCTGRAADLRAEAGLVRVGLEMAADEVDFKDFTQKVMARVTPEKPPLLERWTLSIRETFQYQRRMMFASMATAAVVALIAIPLAMRQGDPLGYAAPQMAVQSVTTDEGATVAPVVMTTEDGDAIIWVVDQGEVAPAAIDKDNDDDDDDEDVFPGNGNGQAPPKGGEL
jgi:anti-sigma factor RsiW